MKKRIIISLSILAVAIITAVILIIVLTPKKNEEIEIKIEGYGYRRCEPVVLDLGKHKVKDFEKDKTSNEQYHIKFYVDSGEDFFFDYIKTNKGYIPELDFKVGGWNHNGFLVIDNNVFEYKVDDDLICIYSSYGSFIDYDNFFEFESDRFYILGDFSSNNSFDKLDIEFDPEHPYKTISRQSYTKVSYNDFIKIYNYIDSDICKVEDNVVYLKAFYDNFDGEMKLTDDYFVTISEVNGRPTLSRSNMLNEL